jgi:DNA polymerase III epsilon subunit-like protein
MRSPDAARAPSWHHAPAGLRQVGLGRFGRLAPPGPYAVVDVETTGLDPDTDRIVEVAVVRCDAAGRIVSEWSSLVQPDARFLHEEWRRSGTARPRLPGLCTLTLDRTLHPGRPDGYSLAACVAARGIAQPDAHRALADARVTAELLGALLSGLPAARRPWPRRRLRLR